MSRWIRRHSIPWPTWRVWLPLMAVLALLIWSGFRGVYPFLALVEPMPEADLLVMEGWIPDYAVQACAEMFGGGGYRWICTTGVAVEVGAFFAEAGTYAGLGAATLRENGIAEDVLIVAHGPEVYRDRTYHSAVALRDELASRGLLAETKGIQLISFGTHARRSRNTFRAVFQPLGIAVKVISIPTRGYDPALWYRSSGGVKAVLMELISLTYEAWAGPEPEAQAVGEWRVGSADSRRFSQMRK